MVNSQKFSSLLTSEKVNIWKFQTPKRGKQYFYWLTSEPTNHEGYGFFTLEEMVNEAYRHIDPVVIPKNYQPTG